MLRLLSLFFLLSPKVLSIPAPRGTVLWLLSLFFLLALSGCGYYDVMNFNEAAAGLATPSIELYEGNASRFVDRIRWMELAIKWEHVTIKPHDLSFLISTKETPSTKASCSPNCRACLSGDVTKGYLDLSCWTQKQLDGTMELEVPNLSSSQGLGYERWQSVCKGKDKLKNPEVDSFCFQGDTGYSSWVTQSDNRSTRLDVLWVVRLRTQEGQEDPIRLDGTVGTTFLERNGAPSIRRTAVFLEDKGVLYRNFQGNERGGSVEILAANGLFLCDFQISVEGARLKKSGTCKPTQAGEANIQWP